MLLEHWAVPAQLRTSLVGAVRRREPLLARDMAHAVGIELEKAGEIPDVDSILADAEQMARMADELDALAARQDAEGMPVELDLRALAGKEPCAPISLIDGFPLWQGEVTLLGGHGGAGKSQVALYLAACLASGRPFYGMATAKRRTAYLSIEDPQSVLHWRLSRICAWSGARMADLSDDLKIWDASESGGAIVTDTIRDGLALTPLRDWLAERMQQVDVLVIDGASDAFDANEVVRRAVRFFIRTVRKLIPKTGAVILLAHVDKPAAKTPGTSQGYSGSTAWHNSVRARWYLRPAKAQEDNDEPDELVLEVQKSNHGKHGQRLTLRWSDEAHLFVGEALPAATRLDRELANADARERLVEIIRAADPPIPAAATGPRTAFTAMQARGLPEVYGRDKKRFWRDLEALRAAGAVVEVQRKTPDRKVRLVLGAA